jgi:acetylornithine deacetylase/succinyl-diaminopimelate desuccinylase-like protein
VNPHGDPGTHDMDAIGEQLIAEWLAEFLCGCGAEVELRGTVHRGRPNVVAHWPSTPGAGRKPRLLLAPHTDTVSVAGMTIHPFAGDVSEGKVWGRGASDAKGPMAAMLWALREMREQLPRLGMEVWFAGLAGEEAGQHGARALAAQEHFDFVIAGEPTGLDIVHTHKGCTRLKLTTRGRAAHASRPDLGENAIYKMASVVRFISETLAHEMSEDLDPVLGPGTISVGTIRGGTKASMVADRCEAAVDIRTIPGQEAPAFLQHLERRLRGVCPDIEVEAGQSPPLWSDPAHPITAHISQTLGARCVPAPWFCDAAIFAAQGIPSIALGPGSIAQAHTEDEWISIADLERGAAFFERLLASL